MADIIVQNSVKALTQAIQESAAKVNYTNTLGRSLEQHLDLLIRANAAAGPFALPTGTSTGYLCDLTETSKISSCLCNYSGSGISSTASCNTANPWTNGSVLKGATPSVSTAQLVNKILTLDPVLSGINSATTGVSLDIYLTYLGLKATYVSQNLTSILQNWYGIGQSANDAAPLSSVNKLKVCGNNWVCGEGASCTWTVPAGASKAKFQVWGAGQGSNPGCCCGGASFGETGAYAEMVINVTPGTQYSVCAGCSCSRFCCSSETPGYGCMSGVTGPGICCLKADGGHCYQANCDDMNAMRTSIGAGGVCHKFQNPYCTDSGPCWCSYGEYCYSNSCATCGVVPVYPSCCGYNNGCSCATEAAAVKHGPTMVMKGLHGGGCLDGSNYGYHIRPPVIDADTGLEYAGGCRCQTFTSGSECGGCLAAGNWSWHPGYGGAGTHVMGGANSHKGDTGRGGMVQVSWI